MRLTMRPISSTRTCWCATRSATARRAPFPPLTMERASTQPGAPNKHTTTPLVVTHCDDADASSRSAFQHLQWSRHQHAEHRVARTHETCIRATSAARRVIPFQYVPKERPPSRLAHSNANEIVAFEWEFPLGTIPARWPKIKTQNSGASFMRDF